MGEDLSVHFTPPQLASQSPVTCRSLASLGCDTSDALVVCMGGAGPQPRCYFSQLQDRSAFIRRRRHCCVKKEMRVPDAWCSWGVGVDKPNPTSVSRATGRLIKLDPISFFWKPYRQLVVRTWVRGHGEAVRPVLMRSTSKWVGHPLAHSW